MQRRLIRALPLLVLVAAGALSGVAMGASTDAKKAAHAKTATVDTVKSSKFGTVLIGANGHTLYRFTTDRRNMARCTGNCNVYWMPVQVKPGTKPTSGGSAKASLLGTIKSSHGMNQVTYAGHPLYTYFEDYKAGQFNGEGASNAQNGIKPAGLWYVVNTAGAFVKKATGSGSSSTGKGGGGGYSSPY